MCEIELLVKDHAGKQKTLMVDTSNPNLGLSYYQLTAIDLSPLENFEKLEVLTLYSNELHELDLKPLSRCSKLKILRVGINHLRQVDLSPLSFCKHLEVIDFGANRLEEIKLHPLHDLHSLRTLRLDNNRIKDIDLSPLASCGNLRFVDLSVNLLTSLDLWPFAPCLRLEKLPLYGNNLSRIDVTPLLLFGSSCRLHVDEDTHLLAHPGFCANEMENKEEVGRQFELPQTSDESLWKEVMFMLPQMRELLPKDSDILLQLLILKLAKIDELGLYDGPIDDLLGFVESCSSYEKAREDLYERMLELVEKQLEASGSTVFIDIDKLSTSRASKIIPKALQRRKTEIEGIRLHVHDDMVDLRPLWLTSYGFDILRTMQVNQLEVSVESFKKIRKAFKEVGISIRTRKTQVRKSPSSLKPSMSKQMIQHILTLVNMEGAERIIQRKSGAVDLIPLARVV